MSSTDDTDDWTARHARLRSREHRPTVDASVREEDAWELRHAETRRGQ